LLRNSLFEKLDIEFGDWFLGGVDQLKVLGNYDSLQLDENIQQCHTFLAQTKFGLQEDFFKKIKQQNKGLEISETFYFNTKFILALIIEQTSACTKTSLPTIEVESNRQAFKTSVEQIPSKEFIWIQFYLSLSDDDQSLGKISKYIKKIYQNLREDSILIGVLSGQDPFGRCFIRVKDDAKLTPLVIEGKEYPYDLKLVQTN
jgi:hypothetical protein